LKKRRPKLVLDTNVWVSAFLAKGPPSRIVQMAEDTLIHIFVSLDVLQEINRVLEYEKILRILKRSQMEPSSIMATIMSLSSLVDVKVRVHAIEEDPSDNHVLACAKEARAQFIVSGDRHLLQLGHYEKIMMLTASRFLERQARNTSR
jgi:putative PIN family toxin of toxin-antitoxin system